MMVGFGFVVQEKMKRAAVGPLPGVTQDIAGFKVLGIFFISCFILALLIIHTQSHALRFMNGFEFLLVL